MKRTITPASEDYLEAIFIIQKNQKVARVSHLAKVLGVKAPSVHQALSALKKQKLIKQEKYGYIELTQEGLVLAKKIYARHTMLKTFFQDVLGVNEQTAEKDACRVEHYLSPETIERMVRFIDDK